MRTVNSQQRPYANGRPTLFRNIYDNRNNTISVICKKRFSKKMTKKKSKSVRFDEDVIVRQLVAPSTPCLTWLSRDDYVSIQHNVFMTLRLMNLRAHNSDSTKTNPHYCTRGLEDYSTEAAGALSFKAGVILRRKDRIRVTMAEQESQRLQANHANNFSNDVKMRDACLTRSNRMNGMRAIETSLYDSEAAMAIRAEDRERQKQQPNSL